MLWKKIPFLVSPAAVISSIGLFIAACLWIGITGNRDFTHSWIFVLIYLYLITILLCITLRGWKTPQGKIRYRFILNHAGLLLALASAFWGNPDNRKVRMLAEPMEWCEVAYLEDGTQTTAPESIMLVSYDAEKAIAEVIVSDAVNSENIVTIKVNNPHTEKFGEDIYLVSTGKDYCIFEVVYEPWKYAALVGIIMMLSGAVLLFIKGPKSC